MKIFFILFFIIMSSAFGEQTTSKLTAKDLTVTGKLLVSSTTKASRPCPGMTQVQRDAIASPASGDCIYNTSTNTLNAYNGATWGSIGGGLSAWSTAYVYQTGDVVISSNKIYKALSAHTSGTFATDLAAGKWVELSAPQDLTGPITSSAGVSAIASQTGTGSTFVMNTSPTLVTPNLGTPSALVGTNITGTASGLTAGNVTTNANLTGPITSTGNATAIASQTGTGSTFVMSAAPTITGHPTVEGVTATGATGTGKFVFDTTPQFATTISVGTTRNDAIGLNLAPTLNSAATQYGIFNQTIFRENTLTAGTGIYSSVKSGNPAYTLPNAYAFEAGPASLGTSSTITNATGFMIRDQTVGSGSKYGIQNEVASGTNKWGYYGSGSANNYFGGPVSISTTANTTPNANAVLDVTSTTKAFMPPRMTTTQKLAIASPAAGMEVYDSTLNAKSVYDGTSWINGLGTISVDTDWTTFTPTSPNSSLTFSSTNCYWARAQSDMLIRCNFIPTAGASGASEAQITLPNSVTTASTLSTPTNTGTLAIGTNTASSYYILAKPSVAYIGIGVQNAGGHATVNLTGNTVADTNPMSMFARVPIQGWSSTGATYSSASANYDWVSKTTTLSGFGTGHSIACKYRRVGGDLEGECHGSTGTGPAGSLATITLPDSLALDTARITNAATTASSGQDFGKYEQNSVANAYGSVLANTGTSTTSLYIGGFKTGTTQLLPQNGSTVLTASVVTNISFKVPISGWSNVSQVVANVSGYAQTPGVAGSATPNISHFKFNYGATINTNCTSGTCAYLDQIGTEVSSVVRTGVGTYTLNFARTYSKLKCTGVVRCGATDMGAIDLQTSNMSCASCNTLTLTTAQTSTAAACNSFGIIDCDGNY